MESLPVAIRSRERDTIFYASTSAINLKGPKALTLAPRFFHIFHFILTHSMSYMPYIETLHHEGVLVLWSVEKLLNSTLFYSDTTEET